MCKVMLKAGFFLLLFVLATAFAQESPDANESAETQAQATEAGQTTEQAAEGAPEVFDPTEEISEDYSVEFPVDI